MASPGSTPAKSAGRALELIELLSLWVGDPAGPTFTDICQRVPYPRSSVHYLMAQFSERGWVKRDDAGRYKLELPFHVAYYGHGQLDLGDA